MKGYVILTFHGFDTAFWDPLNLQDKSSEGTLCECESLSLLTRFPNSTNVNLLGTGIPSELHILVKAATTSDTDSLPHSPMLSVLA